MALKKILLVDDDRGANFLTRLILDHCKVEGEIDIALDGQHALDLIEAKDFVPDVILLDINMPKMDGFEFLEALKDKTKCYHHSRVFVLSSSQRDADKEAALTFSCVKDYFEKPLTPAAIEKVFG
jgi:CheY-like chemotaxis protein